MPKLNKQRILIVEDDEIAREQYRRYLSNLAEIKEAERVDQVLENLLDGIDLIILDIHLESEKFGDPSRAGVEILRRIRERQPPFRNIPVIVVTGLIQPEVEEKCRELGVVEFLQKPGVKLEYLYKLVKETLSAYAKAWQIKVFVSSTMRDLEADRRVVKEAIQDLGPIYFAELAEDWHARTGSPQNICREAVRECDIFVLILGTRYGDPVAEGSISPVEEEYNSAVFYSKPILVFVKESTERDPRLEAFRVKIGAFKHGRLFKKYNSLEILRIEIQNAIRAETVNLVKQT